MNRSVREIKSFEQCRGLDTALYKNLSLLYHQRRNCMIRYFENSFMDSFSMMAPTCNNTMCSDIDVFQEGYHGNANFSIATKSAYMVNKLNVSY